MSQIKKASKKEQDVLEEVNEKYAQVSVKEKAQYWVGVLYPENMISDWEEKIGDLVQVPYAYCIHDKDKLNKKLETDEKHDERKVHIHLMLIWRNPTTYNNACSVFNSLAVKGKKCFAWIEKIKDIRYLYEYLLHNTETAKKQGKYQYDKSERKTGNNFDIGAFEQLSVTQKEKMAQELCDIVVDKGFRNFMKFYKYVRKNYDTDYFKVLRVNSGILERLCKGNYQQYISDIQEIERLIRLNPQNKERLELKLEEMYVEEEEE